MSLGSRINEIRKARGMSIDDLCEKSGIPKGTISKITADITKSPTLETVRAIATALECKLDDLDDPPENTKTPPEGEALEEQKLLELFRQLNPPNRQLAFQMIELLIKSQSNQ